MSVKVVSESWDYFDWKIDKKKQVYTLKKDSYIILNLDVICALRIQEVFKRSALHMESLF